MAGSEFMGVLLTVAQCPVLYCKWISLSYSETCVSPTIHARLINCRIRQQKGVTFLFLFLFLLKVLLYQYVDASEKNRI